MFIYFLKEILLLINFSKRQYPYIGVWTRNHLTHLGTVTWKRRRKKPIKLPFPSFPFLSFQVYLSVFLSLTLVVLNSVKDQNNQIVAKIEEDED